MEDKESRLSNLSLHCRQQAERARRLANAVEPSDVAEKLRRYAISLDEEADRFEQRAASMAPSETTQEQRPADKRRGDGPGEQQSQDDLGPEGS